MAAGLQLDNPNPVTFPASFDAAVLEGGYRSGDGCWNAYVNRDLLSIWGEDAWLGRPAIVERFAGVMRMRARFVRYHGTPEQPRTWSDAGTALNRRRPPGFPNATRIIALRTMAQEVAVTLLLRDEARARVTVRWKPLDRAYEWRDADLSSRPVRHCWADDTGEWITLPL